VRSLLAKISNSLPWSAGGTLTSSVSIRRMARSRVVDTGGGGGAGAGAGAGVDEDGDGDMGVALLTTLSRMSPIWFMAPCMPTTAVAGVSFDARAALVIKMSLWCADRGFLAGGGSDINIVDAIRPVNDG